MSDTIQVNDIGTQFKCTIKENEAIVDISSATVMNIIFKKPDSTSLTVDAFLFTDGTDGIIYYNAETGDLDQAGMYKIQAHVSFGDESYYSNIGSFRVKCNL